MIDILVVSKSAVRKVNRYIYNLLAQKYNLKIDIVTSEFLKVGEQKIFCEPLGEDEYVFLHKLRLTSDNPRTYRYNGINQILETKKPKIIHIDNDPVSQQAVQLGKWAKKHNAELTCLSCENLPFGAISSLKRNGTRGLLAGIVKEFLAQKSKRMISHVFTINNDGTAIFKDYGFKSVSKIPLGFNADIFYPDQEARRKIRQQYNFSHNDTIIAYIGRTTHEKGVHILLKALSLIKDEQWYLILDEFKDAKTSYQTQIVRLIEELGLSSKVKYFDASHTEIARYMNCADVIVMPSISTPTWVEQYGRVAPEAMACGKIVVASHVGALPELIDSAGILIAEGNVKLLSDTLREIINYPEKFQHLHQKAMSRSKELDIEKQAETMYSVFQDLI